MTYRERELEEYRGDGGEGVDVSNCPAPVSGVLPQCNRGGTNHGTTKALTNTDMSS